MVKCEESVCFCSLFLILSFAASSVFEDREVYIVYLGSVAGHEDEEYSLTSLHQNLIQDVISDGISASDLLIRSYKRSFSGFAANLTKGETQKIAEKQGVVSVFPNKILHLHTTRSWEFLGLHQTTERNKSKESDTIIGVIDTGIWPESASFKDDGFGPPPKKWRGECKGGANFTCNNKLIGARFYSGRYQPVGDSARDDIGHGSHTASTVAGNRVPNVSFYGLAKGTATGGVPSARIAVYKACDQGGCSDDQILSAFDDAIADGVDIITISIGFSSPLDFSQDSIAIGSFHATVRGILTVNSAGNNGPTKSSTSSVSPWLLSVAASTTDRHFVDKGVLGNGHNLAGLSVNSFTSRGKKYPLTFGKPSSEFGCGDDSNFCADGCLDSNSVKGKIFVCSSSRGIEYSAGAAGAITFNDVTPNISFVVPLPAISLNSQNYDVLLSYMNSTRNPVVEIFKSEATRDVSAPLVAEFSSRGPNAIIPEILKPDISAPGVEILAAYSPLASPSDYEDDHRAVNYSILSGTSMSCPHVAAIAAYIKSFHPDWSPAAIKSAIMTTATPMAGSFNDSTGEYAHGAGHVNPVQAVHPGLVYAAFKEDYVQMLCNLGYTDTMISLISGEPPNCSKTVDRSLVKNLNYPALAIEVPPNKAFNVKFNRTVTNVGTAVSTYKAMIVENPKIKITVVPKVLSFKSLKERKSFTVIIEGGALAETMLSSSLTWSDGVHSVKSPITVNVKLKAAAT